MSEIYLTPFSPSLGSALAKALTEAQYREIDRGMKPPMTQQEAVDYAGQTNRPRSRSRGNQAVPTNMYERIDAMNPRSNMPTGQREFELGNSVRGSLGPQNRLIQERNRSPISNISRDVGSAARRGLDRAASSLAPIADAARKRFSDAGESVREGAQAAGEAMGRARSAMGATASNVASQIPGMADAARRKFNQTSQMVGDQVRETGEAIGRGARQARQAIGQGATQARDAMNRGAMNVASKIHGMARAAGRMVGTAGRKAKDVADTSYGVGQDIAGQAMKYGARGSRALGRKVDQAIDNIDSEKVYGSIRETGRAVGRGTRGAGNFAMGAGRGAMNVASRLPGMAAAAGRFMMGTNNRMANQPLANQTSGSKTATFGNNKTSETEGEGEEQSQQAAPSGYTPNQGMLDNLYQQNLDRAQTRGGIGTGVMSNLLTGGLSGLARGAYNMRQRNIARQNLQNLSQRGADAVPFLRSEYETMNDRSIIRSRMTTEAIRNAYVF